MRMIRILQVGCVSGLAISPSMAAELEKVQAEAIKGGAQAAAAPATPNPNWRKDVAAARAEREKALQMEAQLARALRAEKLAQRDAEWEAAVTLRAAAMREEALARQAQFESQLSASKPTTEVALARPVTRLRAQQLQQRPPPLLQ